MNDTPLHAMPQPASSGPTASHPATSPPQATRDSPAPLIRSASAALADVCATLSTEREDLRAGDRFTVAGDIELIVRRSELAAVLHAGHFASAEASLKRSRTTTAANLAEATGCSRPQAHTRLDTFDLIGTIAGRAFADLRITGTQARAITAAREPYQGVLDDSVLDRAEERIVHRAGTKSAATLKQEIQTALSPKLPSDGKDRQAQQKAARAARLYGQQADGMSKLVLNVTPGTRSLLGGLSAQASANRAKLAEQAAKLGHVPVDISHEQAFHDLLVEHLGEANPAHPAPAAKEPSTGTDPHLASTDAGADDTPASASTTPVASIVIRLLPGEWNNLGTLVSTNSGAVVSVRDALDMAARGPSFLSTTIAGRERLFRIDEIDADTHNAGSRFADALQRLVLYAGSGGCRFPGCDEPAVRCQVHHLTPWNDGGRTTLNNLVLVCRAHHNRINDSPDGWRVRRNPANPDTLVWERNFPPAGNPAASA